MYRFDYHRAGSVAQAAALLAERGEAVPLAGGMTLIPTLKHRLAAPSDLVDLGFIEGLSGIAIGSETVTIGAMTRHADVAASAELARVLPILPRLAGHIGDRQVRSRGTIGGSLANNDPAACYPAAALALGATIVTDRREIAADDYFQGLFATALEPGELIVAIRFPRVDAAAYAKFANPASRYAMVGVAVARGAGTIRVAVTGAGSGGVFRPDVLEAALAVDFSPEAALRARVDADDLMSDIHAQADYRAHLISVMASRAVADCLGGAA
ncbi:FAD binding domain-containing protein [Polymorphum gilvum]|uniref:Putative carbon monoxide dehydrogenase medium subunit, coxM-like protein n=1 Tax=Polymorphum gilvum (strain LMG 25793 / CGMCC 1.9160 / SL003B-26A1) TaxID=991905 RepID=F2IYN0_POLGS|nr:FAD binding domain-containing protein [Polymorphum gilvum]ADZ69477.1 Putative carbon monoxide dehydrogenase medium subunit, coxM-like protein [Polymorphum gilvum SL003B-26A1]